MDNVWKLFKFLINDSKDILGHDRRRLGRFATIVMQAACTDYQSAQIYPDLLML